MKVKIAHANTTQHAGHETIKEMSLVAPGSFLVCAIWFQLTGWLLSRRKSETTGRKPSCAKNTDLSAMIKAE